MQATTKEQLLTEGEGLGLGAGHTDSRQLTATRAEAVSPRTEAAWPPPLRAPATQAASRCHTRSAHRSRRACRRATSEEPNRHLQLGQATCYCIIVNSEAGLQSVAHLLWERCKISHLCCGCSKLLPTFSASLHLKLGGFALTSSADGKTLVLCGLRLLEAGREEVKCLTEAFGDPAHWAEEASELFAA